MTPAISATVPRVILIGGAPMSGKTSAARAMARILGRTLISTDDLGEAVRALTSPATHRDLHACGHADLPTYYASSSPADLLEDAKRAHRALWPAIESVVRAHAAWAGPTIVEGWAILLDRVHHLGLGSVAAVCIGVPAAVIEARVRADAAFRAAAVPSELAIEHFVGRSVAFQLWLREQGIAAGLPFLDLAGGEPAGEVARRCLDALAIAEAKRLRGRGRTNAVLETDVSIRPYRVGDAPALCEAARESVREIRPFMPWCRPDLTIDEARRWIEAQVSAFDARTAFEFVILSAAGTLLGGCGLNQIDDVNRRANVGYWVRSSATRRGVATTAIRQLVQWTFTNTDLARLEVVVSTQNAASLRVAEKSGAVREGVLAKRLWLHGTSHDAVLFSFVRDAERTR